MEAKYISFSKTINGNGDLKGRLEHAVEANIISPIGQEEEGKMIYRGPNYFLSIEKLGNNLNSVQIFSEGSPSNEPYLRKIIGRTLN